MHAADERSAAAMTRTANAGNGYWACWSFATLTTGLLAGFLLGHCLILGRFFSWMVASGRQPLISETYAVFRQEQGVQAYLALLVIQTLATVLFLIVALVKKRGVGIAAVAALASPLWYAVHFASGLAVVEPTVVGSLHPVPTELASRFVSLNLPVHLLATALMVAALSVLLTVPMVAMRRAWFSYSFHAS
jgi:hypothetical protein